jgi:hypothetical protein
MGLLLRMRPISAAVYIRIGIHLPAHSGREQLRRVWLGVLAFIVSRLVQPKFCDESFCLVYGCLHFFWRTYCGMLERGVKMVQDY